MGTEKDQVIPHPEKNKCNLFYKVDAIILSRYRYRIYNTLQTFKILLLNHNINDKTCFRFMF